MEIIKSICFIALVVDLNELYYVKHMATEDSIVPATSIQRKK